MQTHRSLCPACFESSALAVVLTSSPWPLSPLLRSDHSAFYPDTSRAQLSTSSQRYKRALHTLLPTDHLYNAKRHGTEFGECWRYAWYCTHTVVCHDIMVLARWESTFWRNIMPSSSASKNPEDNRMFQVIGEGLANTLSWCCTLYKPFFESGVSQLLEEKWVYVTYKNL
jgi:hypothetical protein